MKRVEEEEEEQVIGRIDQGVEEGGEDVEDEGDEGEEGEGDEGEEEEGGGRRRGS